MAEPNLSLPVHVGDDGERYARLLDVSAALLDFCEDFAELPTEEILRALRGLAKILAVPREAS